MIENEHAVSNSPNISSKARVPLASSKLVLWSSETWCSCWEIWNIIILFISNCSKIDYFDLVSQIRSLLTEDIIHFDIAIADGVIMEILYCFTNLKEYDPCDVCQIISSIFFRNILDYLRVTIVSAMQLIPIHNLA